MTAVELAGPVMFDVPSAHLPTLAAIRDDQLRQLLNTGSWTLDGKPVDVVTSDIGPAIWQTFIAGLIERHPDGHPYRLTAGGEAALRTGAVVAEGQAAAILAGWRWPVRDQGGA